MTDETQEIILKEPTNELDPKVVIDPQFNQPITVERFDNEESMYTSGNYINPLKDNAINIPIVRLNTILLKDHQINYLRISYDSFTPTMRLSINDNENFVRTCSTPGMENEVVVVITSPINGYYKKINLRFYVVKVEVFGNFLALDCVYKFPLIDNVIFKQIGSGKLSTYEMLKAIAIDTSLGFAATPKCEEIKDERYRIVRSKTYRNYIDEQMKFAGIDEDSVFEAWIDLFGYIVMVNTSMLMREEIDPTSLSITTMVGNHSFIDAIDDVKPIKIPRVLTNNYNIATNYNMLFDNYEILSYNNEGYAEGSLVTGISMNSPCEDNTLNTEQVQIVEESGDGYEFAKDYEYHRVNFLGVEFSEDMPILTKEMVNSKFFQKMNAKKIKVNLKEYNLGLERGTIVSVIFKEYNERIIQALNGENLEEAKVNGIVNPYLSGQYYIQSMEFVYKTENHKIEQSLILVKKGYSENPLSKTSTI